MGLSGSYFKTHHKNNTLIFINYPFYITIIMKPFINNLIISAMFTFIYNKKWDLADVTLKHIKKKYSDL